MLVGSRAGGEEKLEMVGLRNLKKKVTWKERSWGRHMSMATFQCECPRAGPFYLLRHSLFHTYCAGQNKQAGGKTSRDKRRPVTSYRSQCFVANPSVLFFADFEPDLEMLSVTSKMSAPPKKLPWPCRQVFCRPAEQGRRSVLNIGGMIGWRVSANCALARTGGVWGGCAPLRSWKIFEFWKLNGAIWWILLGNILINSK